MAKNKRSDQNNDQLKNYYQLNTDAVDRLVNADKNTSPEVNREELDTYRSGFLYKIPGWIKALFIKYWFSGACCFFFYWGLGIYVTDELTKIFILGIAIGVITDLLVNNLFRFLESTTGENSKWMLLPKKAYWTFLVNMLYATLVVVLVVLTYDGINALIINVKNLPEDSIPLGVEPFLFGLFYLAYDMAFVWLKNAIVYLIKHKKVNYND